MLRYACKVVAFWFVGVIGFAFLYGNAQASELYGSVTVGSKHLGDKRGYEYNERNLGIGLEYYAEEAPCGIAGGAYDNSYNRTSVYLLRVCRVSLYRGNEITVRGAAGAGIISGYNLPGVPHVGPFVPAGNISASIESRSLGFGLNTIFIPKVSKDGNSVIGLQVKKSF